MASHLVAHHIQDHNEANTTLQHHWGYPSRVLPCKKDAGTCEYLDAVYGMHDTSMLYTLIFWGVLLGIAVLWLFVRGWRMDSAEGRSSGLVERCRVGVVEARRRWLMADAPKGIRRLFGRVSKLHVVVLAILLAYLLIFSLVDIIYRTWHTPISGTNLHNNRTGLDGFSDRLGALAYALTSFTILLSMRESVLSLITGIPCQHFNLLHGWTGCNIFVQAVIHTLGWTIIEGKLYQPQLSVYREVMGERYVVFKVVAMFLLTAMAMLSSRAAIRWFGYEFLNIGHWGLAVLYVGACRGHWDRLWCWIVASLTLIALDQGVRMGRTAYTHWEGRQEGNIGFYCAHARVHVIGSDGDLVVRLDFDYEHRQPWLADQHSHLTFPTLTIWQSHPFTPSSPPDPNSKLQHHTYLLRVRKGITARLAALGDGATGPVILGGPYRNAYPSYGAQKVLAVVGGTGVTFALPVVLGALREQTGPRYAIEFMWVVRRARDLVWLQEEVAGLKTLQVKVAMNLQVNIFITRESESEFPLKPSKKTGHPASESLSSSEIDDIVKSTGGYKVGFLGGRHPAVVEELADFMERSATVGGSVEVVGSGPEPMGSDRRSAVATL